MPLWDEAMAASRAFHSPSKQYKLVLEDGKEGSPVRLEASCTFDQQPKRLEWSERGTQVPERTSQGHRVKLRPYEEVSKISC